MRVCLWFVIAVWDFLVAFTVLRVGFVLAWDLWAWVLGVLPFVLVLLGFVLWGFMVATFSFAYVGLRVWFDI